MTVEEARALLLASVRHLLAPVVPPYAKLKIIHDPLWGTCTYEPWEATLLDLPLLQRLRGIKQTGLAYLTYPAAEHSRFQHTLGVVEAASRVFDSIRRRAASGGLAGALATDVPASVGHEQAPRNRMLLRLAAMLHDTGHSVLSHTSERIFSLTEPFADLIAELRQRFKKATGAAEVVVYLLLTSEEWQTVVANLWKATGTPHDAPKPAEWERIGRWIMGVERDPDLKFLCDIVSGPLDADKLDYVARDAYFAGISVAYDLHRFVSTVCVDRQQNPETGKDWLRLTFPLGKGVNALEQLVMSRLALFSYVYHHQKVRAAEAYFERLLVREYLVKKTIAGTDLWDLFAVQDALLYGCASRSHLVRESMRLSSLS